MSLLSGGSSGLSAAGFSRGIKASRSMPFMATAMPALAPTAASAQAPAPTSDGVMLTLVLVALSLAFYFLPALIAAARNHHNVGPILILNFLLGWTGIAWVAALVWALTRPAPAPSTDPAQPAKPSSPPSKAAAPRPQPAARRLAERNARDAPGGDERAALFLRYRDAEGAATARRITVRQVTRRADGDVLVVAYCHERRAMRSFLASRVDELIDLSTGEVAENPTAYLAALDRQ